MTIPIGVAPVGVRGVDMDKMLPGCFYPNPKIALFFFSFPLSLLFFTMFVFRHNILLSSSLLFFSLSLYMVISMIRRLLQLRPKMRSPLLFLGRVSRQVLGCAIGH